MLPPPPPPLPALPTEELLDTRAFEGEEGRAEEGEGGRFDALGGGAAVEDQACLLVELLLGLGADVLEAVELAKISWRARNAPPFAAADEEELVPGIFGAADCLGTGISKAANGSDFMWEEERSSRSMSMIEISAV
jgi:hypothetical protein